MSGDAPPSPRRRHVLLWTALLAVHLVGLVWLGGSWDNLRVMLYDLHEVPEAAAAESPPEVLAATWPYQEDDPDVLGRFREVASSLVVHARSAPERARALGDYIYGLRRMDQRGLEHDLRNGPDLLLDLMQDGWLASCGQATVVFATLWRSLGGHSKMVRWSNAAGVEGHYSVSLWDEQRRRWFYYDLNLNGFLTDPANGAPLTTAETRARLLNGGMANLSAHPIRRAFTREDLATLLARYPVESFVLNNAYMRWSPTQRFGMLNAFHDLLASLPRPADRIIDNLTGHRDSRLVAEGRIRVAGVVPPDLGRVALLYLVMATATCLVGLWRLRQS